MNGRGRRGGLEWMAGLPPVRPNHRVNVEPWDRAALHAKQLAFLDAPEFEALFGGAAGGGKTEALLADALAYVHRPRYKALILRRTFKALNLPDSIMHRAHAWLGRANWHEADKRFVWPNGATIQFGYCESEGDLDRYKSAQFHRIYIDELTEWPERWYAFLFSRIRRTAGDDIPLAMRAATNPDGLGAEWVRPLFAIPEGALVEEPLRSADGSRVFIPSRAEDNPTLDLASYERSLSRLGPARYQQLRWGRWIRDTAGLVYKHFDPKRNIVDELPEAAEWRYVLGADYGFNDPTAFVVLGWPRYSRVVYVLLAEKHEGLIPQAAAERVQELNERFAFDAMVGDAGGLGKGYVEEARQRHYLPIEAAEKQNKLGYIDLVNGAFARQELRLLRSGCEPLIKELGALPWDEAKQQEAAGFDNHATDAMLYGWRRATAWAEGEAPEPVVLTDELLVEQGREARRARVQAAAEGRDGWGRRGALSRPSRFGSR